MEPISHLFRRYGEDEVVVELDGGFNPDEGEKPPNDSWVTVRTYLPPDSRLPLRRAQIEAGVRLVAYVAEIGDLTERVIEETDWREAYKRDLGTLAIGNRLLVVPSWESPSVTNSREVIRLDPGLAFGTGHHPTTKMCLQLIEEQLQPGMDMVDVGCGSGILSIAAVKLGARSVLALDIDAEAILAARNNVHDNGVDRVVVLDEGTLPHITGTRAFDFVVANISSTVVIDIAEALTKSVRPGGKVIVSGVVEERGDEVSQALIDKGLSIIEIRRQGGWLALIADRLKDIG